MKFPHILSLIFIFAALSYHPALAQQQFTVPDLGINNVAATCQNVDTLLAAAQSDTARIQNFTQNQIPNSISTVQAALSLFQQICNIQLRVAPLSLLQAQAANSKLRSGASSNLKSSAEETSGKLRSRQDKDQLYNDLIADKAEELSNQLLITSRQSTSTNDPQGFEAACINAKTSAQNLLAYLNFLNTQITQQTQAIDLPQRLATLQATKADCVALITQSGSYVTKYIETNHVMQQNNQNYLRNDDIKITFPVPFVRLPSVGVMPYGLDLDHAEFSVQVSALNVSLTGFTLRITALPNVRVYNCYVNYIATVSEKSGLYIISHSIDSSTDSSVNAILKNGQKDTKNVTRSLNISTPLPNPQIAVFIRGFDFAGTFGRLAVYGNANTGSVTYQPWWDTVMNSAAVTALYWSGNDKSIFTKSYSSTYNGPLTQNFGDRQETFSFKTTGYLSTPVSVFGLWYLDVDGGYNFRLRQSLTGSPSGWTFSIGDWDNTKLYQIQDNIILTCPTIDKTKCFSG